jgi:hypothetical protein
MGVTGGTVIYIFSCCYRVFCFSIDGIQCERQTKCMLPAKTTFVCDLRAVDLRPTKI